jgi:hypothetical protein
MSIWVLIAGLLQCLQGRARADSSYPTEMIG